MKRLKNITLAVLFIALIGFMSRLEYQDTVKSAEYDKQMKQEVIKQWEQRCSHGDIFDIDVCQAIMQ
jgi:cell division protein FtsI/penicillin-binding protein 2